MGISWKSRFMFLWVFKEAYWQLQTQLEDMGRNETGFVMDRMAEFMRDVQNGQFDHIHAYVKPHTFVLDFITQDRQELFEDIEKRLLGPQ